MFGPQVQPNDQMKSTSRGLYILFFVGLTLSLCKFAGGSLGSSMAINEIIGLLLFACGIYSYNYCLIVVYIVLVLFNMLQFIMIVGKDIQNQKNPFNTEGAGFGGYQFFYIIMIVTFIYDIVSCVVCFKAYKLFKYETLKGFMGSGTQPGTFGQGNAGGNGNGNGGQNPNHNQPNQEQPGEDFSPFRGQGVRIG